jgi:hypothetical protein
MIHSVKYANNITHDDGTITVAVVVEMEENAWLYLSQCLCLVRQDKTAARFHRHELNFCNKLLQEILTEAEKGAT